MGKKFGVPDVTANFMDVLNDPQVQMIKIATSHEVHMPIIEAAAAKGIHIFCEKPMAMEQKETFKIIRSVRRSGIKLCVDFNRRMAPPCRRCGRNGLNTVKILNISTGATGKPNVRRWRFRMKAHLTQCITWTR